MVKINRLNIQNFKSFENVTIFFNENLNVITGINNSGKTTILEALSLWNECFDKLISQAKKAVKGKYVAGDYILGPSGNKYFGFDEINSVRSPNFEDLFRNRDKKNKIRITAELKNELGETIEITFKIGDSVGKYIIELENFGKFDFEKFNKFFKNLPESIFTYYASPVAFIKQEEQFVTEPQVKEAIKKRESSEVIRNRIYRLSGYSLFEQFQKDLSYILFNSIDAKITFHSKSNISKDTRVVINFTNDNKDIIEKDIALLGSGTLQAIEILLNLYQQSNNKDLNIILLDEPDSHIHRDIQKRLLEILLKFSKDNQLFITTHNEALIRSTNLHNLFHVDGSPVCEIHNMYKKDLTKIQPRFQGIYPSEINPIIKQFGYDTGLDFINAIEADRIIFVEGEDDARIIYKLLQQYQNNHSRKFLFWVLGGFSKIFKNLPIYKVFFSEIKNKQSLWSKSFLVFDKDCITDIHIELISKGIKNKLLLPNYCMSVYTQEAILFTDFAKLNLLLTEFLHQKNGIDKSKMGGLLSDLENSYKNIKTDLKEKYKEENVTEESSIFYKQYWGTYVSQTKTLLNIDLEPNEVKLVENLKKYYNKSINSDEFYKLMTKEDVEKVLNDALKQFNVTINIETDFYELIKLVDKSTWFEEWNFLKNL
jgi:AAA15 family ATPase/GTPase